MRAAGSHGRENGGAGAPEAPEATAEGVAARARRAAEEAGHRAQALAAGASEAAAKASQGAEATVRSTGRQVGGGRGTTPGAVPRGAAATGERLERLGAPDAVRQPAQATVEAAAGAAEGLAGRLERGGAYLEAHGAAGLLEDLTGVLRRHPGPVLGLLLARARCSCCARAGVSPD